MDALVLAEEFVPPGPADFNFPPIFAGVTKPMVLVVLSVVIISAFFLLSTRRMQLVPGKLQFVVESIYNLTRNNIAREQIGSHDFQRFIPLIFALFTFVFVNNIYGIIPMIHFPTMSNIGYPVALALLVVYPVYHYAGLRRHGFVGYFKHQLFPSGVPIAVYPLLAPIEFFTKFVMNPITLAIRVFAAMFAGHLLILMFALGGAWLLLHGDLLLKPLSVFSFGMFVAVTFLEALIMTVQAYIFALLTASYIGSAVATEH